MVPPKVDYSLYLVTDPYLVPNGTTLEEQVQKAIDGGVTLVQLREKDAETCDFIERATAIHEITKKAGIPLLINDRVDVALAIDAEGVHIGQEDIDVATARKLLGPDKIIGMSVSYVSEAAKAVEDGVDYVGIGAIYDTATKTPKKPPIGINGARKVLSYLSSVSRYVSTVAIGSLNLKTVRNVVHLSAVPGRRLDGIAVVSAIIAAKDPTAVSKELLSLVRDPPYWMSVIPNRDVSSVLAEVPTVISKVRTETPFVHNIINRVATNFAANVNLSIGSSPAMSENVAEFGDFAAIPNSALLINMGFGTDDWVEKYLAAAGAYAKKLRPIVLDPVAAGASELRKGAVKSMLNRSHFDIIKGNEGEIFSVAGEASQMRGVDSTSNSQLQKKANVVEALAAKEKTIVVLTGKEDVVSDGMTTFVLRNGHRYLADITASGCVLGSIIGAAVAVSLEDRFLAAVASVLLYTIAAERAAVASGVRGPGTFIAALIDELYLLSNATANGDVSWLEAAKVERYVEEA
ncbi:Hydroxyethylthiazole kinase family-domain-containing protein [Lipomyces chichibuensis]|uniref:Hydroxyethylthiazole kinase family-domain-containing protein n=1 Tax=Lipomyces chichibuensis TaxID=1546026 RepID=UPI0033443494